MEWKMNSQNLLMLTEDLVIYTALHDSQNGKITYLEIFFYLNV